MYVHLCSVQSKKNVCAMPIVQFFYANEMKCPLVTHFTEIARNLFCKVYRANMAKYFFLYAALSQNHTQT